MKPIIQYQCDDGSVFPTEEAAKAHEMLLVDIGQAMSPLGPRLPDETLAKGWIQHTEDAYETAKKVLLLMVIPEMNKTGHEPLALKCMADPKAVHPMSYVLRFITENCEEPIVKAWWRLTCIDDKFREHSQPYYAINGPREGQVCVEDRR